MSYRIEPGEGAQEALRRIAREQIDKAIDSIDDGDDAHEAVHDVRKRCKKIRGLLRLYRPALPAYSSENAWFRDTAGRISDARDATSLIECSAALRERWAEDVGEAPFDALREALSARRAERFPVGDLAGPLSEVRDALEAAADRLGSWSLQERGFAALGPGLAKVYRRARKGFGRARERPDTERLHEWRKRVKYHRYHLRLLRALWPGVISPLRDEARLLSDRLGDDHDLAVLRDVLTGEDLCDAGTLGIALPLLDQRRKELQAWSMPVARRLFSEKPGRFRKRMRAVHLAWQVEQKLDAAFPGSSREVS